MLEEDPSLLRLNSQSEISEVAEDQGEVIETTVRCGGCDSVEVSSKKICPSLNECFKELNEQTDLINLLAGFSSVENFTTQKSFYNIKRLFADQHFFKNCNECTKQRYIIAKGLRNESVSNATQLYEEELRVYKQKALETVKDYKLKLIASEYTKQLEQGSFYRSNGFATKSFSCNEIENLREELLTFGNCAIKDIDSGLASSVLSSLPQRFEETFLGSGNNLYDKGASDNYLTQISAMLLGESRNQVNLSSPACLQVLGSQGDEGVGFDISKFERIERFRFNRRPSSNSVEDLGREETVDYDNLRDIRSALNSRLAEKFLKKCSNEDSECFKRALVSSWFFNKNKDEHPEFKNDFESILKEAYREFNLAFSFNPAFIPFFTNKKTLNLLKEAEYEPNMSYDRFVEKNYGLISNVLDESIKNQCDGFYKDLAEYMCLDESNFENHTRPDVLKHAYQDVAKDDFDENSIAESDIQSLIGAACNSLSKFDSDQVNNVKYNWDEISQESYFNTRREPNRSHADQNLTADFFSDLHLRGEQKKRTLNNIPDSQEDFQLLPSYLPSYVSERKDYFSLAVNSYCESNISLDNKSRREGVLNYSGVGDIRNSQERGGGYITRIRRIAERATSEIEDVKNTVEQNYQQKRTGSSLDGIDNLAVNDSSTSHSPSPFQPSQNQAIQTFNQTQQGLSENVTNINQAISQVDQEIESLEQQKEGANPELLKDLQRQKEELEKLKKRNEELIAQIEELRKVQEQKLAEGIEEVESPGEPSRAPASLPSSTPIPSGASTKAPQPQPQPSSSTQPTASQPTPVAVAPVVSSTSSTNSPRTGLGPSGVVDSSLVIETSASSAKSSVTLLSTLDEVKKQEVINQLQSSEVNVELADNGDIIAQIAQEHYQFKLSEIPDENIRKLISFKAQTVKLEKAVSQAQTYYASGLENLLPSL